MNRLCVVILSVGLLASGCSKETTSPSTRPKTSPPATAEVVSLPATLEGQLVLDHSNDWGVWGTFTAGGREYHVAIPAAIYDASKLGDEGGKARLTLSSKDNQFGMDLYQVSAAEKR